VTYVIQEAEIDFTYQMERASGNSIPVLSYYNAQTDYVGGSSVTASSRNCSFGLG
jgi:hypothetical protein